MTWLWRATWSVRDWRMQPASATRTPEIFLDSKTEKDGLRTRDGVKGANLVHVGEGEDELAARGDAAADEAGVAALGDDGDVSVVAPLDDLADLVGGFGLEDGGGMAAVLAHPVIVVGLEVGGGGRKGGDGGDDGRVGENGGKVGEVAGTGAGEEAGKH